MSTTPEAMPIDPDTQPAPTAEQLAYVELRQRFEQWHEGLISDGEFLHFVSLEIVRREGLRAEQQDRAYKTCAECGAFDRHLAWCSQHPCNDRQRVKELAYTLDPECWVSYSGKPTAFKQAMDARRTSSIHTAYEQLQRS